MLPLRPLLITRTGVFAAALVFVSLVVVACGGRTIGIADDAGSCVGCVDANTNTTCVDIDLSTYDNSCQVDSDCTLVTGGQICPGACECGDSPINASGEGKYQAAIRGISFAECGCPYPGTPRCLENQCILCGLGPGGPSACFDLIDSGPPIDAGPPPVDASSGDAIACVDIDLSTYDTSCNQDSDCIDITSGELCTGSCSCGGSSINRSGQMMYDEALAPLMLGACPCPLEGTPRCLQNQCTICNPGGCVDGG